MSAPRISAKLKREREKCIKEDKQKPLAVGVGASFTIPETSFDSHDSDVVERSDSYSEFQNIIGDRSLEMSVAAMEEEELFDWMSELLQGDTQSHQNQSDYQDPKGNFGEFEAQNGIKIGSSVVTPSYNKQQTFIYGSAPAGPSILLSKLRDPQLPKKTAQIIPGVHVSSALRSSEFAVGQDPAVLLAPSDAGSTGNSLLWSQNAYVVPNSTVPAHNIGRVGAPYAIVKPSTSCPANMTEDIREIIGSHVLSGNLHNNSSSNKKDMPIIVPSKIVSAENQSCSTGPASVFPRGNITNFTRPASFQPVATVSSYSSHMDYSNLNSASNTHPSLFLVSAGSQSALPGQMNQSQDYGTFLGLSASSIAGVGLDDSKINRDRLKKDSHNRVERRRRNFINLQIEQLGSLLPNQAFMDAESKRNKGSILRATVSYLARCQSMERVNVTSAEIARKTANILPTLWERIKMLESLLHKNGFGVSSSEQLRGSVEDAIFSCNNLDEERKQVELTMQTLHERINSMNPPCNSSSQSPTNNITLLSSMQPISTTPIDSELPGSSAIIISATKSHPVTGARLINDIDLQCIDLKEKEQYSFATSAPATMFPGNINLPIKSEPPSIQSGEDPHSATHYDMDIDEDDFFK